MKIDVKENEHDFEVFVDLPGFKKENLKLDLTDGYITINANKTLEEEDKKKSFIYFFISKNCKI